MNFAPLTVDAVLKCIVGPPTLLIERAASEESGCFGGASA